MVDITEYAQRALICKAYVLLGVIEPDEEPSETYYRLGFIAIKQAISPARLAVMMALGCGRDPAKVREGLGI